MSTESSCWDSVQRIYHEGRNLSGFERAQFLDHACEGNAELRLVIEELLREDSAETPGTIDDGAPPDELDAAPPAQIGPYRLGRELGRGQMGVVYEAEQMHPRRLVAVKTLHPDLVQRGALAAYVERFEGETEVLGRLEHPGIVPVYHAGWDRRGIPFFAMRLIDGHDFRQELASLCATPSIERTTRAVNVLIRIAETMSFAHEKGVLHRDLKPTNVMIGRFGEIYVLDWGLAGRIDGEDSVASAPATPSSPAQTRVGDRIGTPAYMSPEQALGRNDLVDERSDVYALGAMLYEVVTGSSPTEIQLPLHESPTTTRRRRIATTKRHRLRGRSVPAELAAICDRATALRKAERYGSMREFAADLEAFVERRVVNAYEAGAWAELRKWCVRNRATAVALGLLIAVLIASAGYFVSSQRRAEMSRSHLQRVFSVLARQFRSSAPGMVPTRTERAARIQEFQSLLPLARKLAPLEESYVLEALGTYQFESNDPEAAPTFERVLALRTGRDDVDPHDLAAAYRQFGMVLHARGDLEQAEQCFRRALDVSRTVEGNDSIADAFTNVQLARVLESKGDLVTAAAIFDRIVDRFGSDRSELALVLLGQAHVALGRMELISGRVGAAETLFQSGVKELRSVLDRGHSLVLEAETLYADIMGLQWRFGDAVRLFDDIIDRRRFASSGEGTAILRTRYLRARAQIDDIDVRHDQALTPVTEVLAELEDVLQAQTTLLGPNHPETLDTRRAIATLLVMNRDFTSALAHLRTCLEGGDDPFSRVALGQTYFHLGDLDRAISEIQVGFDGLRLRFGMSIVESVAAACYLSSYLLQAGRVEEALAVAYESRSQPDLASTPLQWTLALREAEARMALGQSATAERLFLEALDGLQAIRAEGTDVDWQIWMVAFRVGMVCAEKDDWPRAEQSFRAAHDTGLSAVASIWFGISLVEQGCSAECDGLVDSIREMLREDDRRGLLAALFEGRRLAVRGDREGARSCLGRAESLAARIRGLGLAATVQLQRLRADVAGA